MFKIVGLLICVSISWLQAMDVDASPVRQQPLTAEAICRKILTEVPLTELSLDSIDPERLRRWGKDNVIASLYYCAVSHLKTTNREHDLNQAKAWYAKSALADDPYALYTLGIIFIKWDKQEVLGRILMQAAADKNYYRARVYLGLEKQDF